MKLSFKQQLIFYFFFFGFLVALMSSFLIFSINKDVQIDKYIEKSSFKFSERENFLLSEINRYKIFLDSIVTDTILNESIVSTKNETYIDTQTINKILISRIKSEEEIYRIRFIDNNGLDINSIIKNKMDSEIHPLENKSYRYYIKETKNLKKGEVWFSKIDLNMEFGQIEQPIRPTLRIVYPVFVKNKKQGIIIINIAMERLLKKLSKTTTYNIYLVDKDGDFIWHQSTNNNFSWSKYLENKKSLKDYYLEDYENILLNDKYIGDKYYSKNLNFDNGESIKMILEIKESLLGLNIYGFLTTMLKGLFLTIFLSIPFIYFISTGLNGIKNRYEEELLAVNKNLKESNTKLVQKTIEIKNESMKVNHLNKTLENRVKEEVEKNLLQNKQILQQSRLAQMGEMISMIAHQWRQPLTAISATTNNLSFKLMMGELDKKEFETEINLISDYSQHLSKTIDDFRNFFEIGKVKEKTTLSSIVNSTLSIVKTSVESKNIKIITNLKCNDEIEIYSNEVKQVILNLIKNAEDILIEKDIKNPIITIDTMYDDDKCILLVKDNGAGVPLDIQEKIFEPYFSTKKEKDGTGLGLYMSKTIIEDHCGGKLTVYNDKEGAVFKIMFCN